MVEPGELLVGGAIIASAYGLITALEFNNNNVVNQHRRRSNMISTTALKKAWNQTITLRGMNEELTTNDGSLLTDTEFALLCHIAHSSGNVNITSVVKHPYFEVTSLSTIKRAVVRLINEDLIHIANTSPDKRERMLAIKEVNGG